MRIRRRRKGGIALTADPSRKTLLHTMAMAALGGCWWPIFTEPHWLQQAARGFLTIWAMEGIHDVILRERGLIGVLPVVGFLFAYGAVCVGVGGRMYRLAD